MEAEPDRVFAPEGESWNSFHERVQRTCSSAWPPTTPDETVVAVCHAGVIMASMRVLLGIAHPRPAHAAAAHQHRADRVGARPVLDRWTLHSFNEAGHLLGLAAAE